MLGERANFFTMIFTVGGLFLIAWGFARVITGEGGKAAWLAFVGGAASLLLVWWFVL